MEENINERLSELGTKILATTRNELYIHMRFLDVALSSFAYVIDPSVNGVGTDGMCMFYHPGALGGMYRQNRVRMNRAYLHMVLHCILHHVTRRKGRDKTLWNISCDIAVESIIDHWHLKCIHMVQTRLRKDIYGQLERNLKVLTAEGIYRQLVSFGLEEKKIKELQMEFRVDDHQYWPEDPKQDLHQEVENKWKNISEKTETDMETFSSEESQQAGDLIGQVPKGEIWKIEEKIYPFIELCTKILSDDPLFFLVNSYTTGLQPAVLTYMLETQVAAKFGGKVVSDEIGLPVSSNGLVLPCGASGRWEK